VAQASGTCGSPRHITSTVFKKALRLSVLPLAAVAVIGFGRMWLGDRARARYAGGQAMHAPLSVDTLGPLPAELVESSGLGVSRRHPGILWTHNDSGDQPRFYALDMSARLVATYDVEGAVAIDWEDTALASCPAEEAAGGAEPVDCLYLADTGDNARSRDTLTVYVVPEPDPDVPTRTVTPLGRLRYRYPDEAHDMEGIAVTRGGDLVLVTKGRTPDVLLFDLPAAALAEGVRADTVVRLAAGRKLPIEPNWQLGRMVTGAAFSPDGATLAVRTYSEIYLFTWPLPAELTGSYTTCFLGTLEPSGEAVDWENASSLLLTSETSNGHQGELTRVRCDMTPRP
jgi:hypothetical protein